MSHHRISLDRVAYRTGSALCARDLLAVERVEEEWSRRHMALVHARWGVAEGLGVVLEASGRAVRVGPGVAFDVCGRALVSSRPMVWSAPVPAPVPRVVDLVLVRAAADDERAPRNPGCQADIPLVRLRWSHAGPPEPGPIEGLPLAPDVMRGVELPLARFVQDPDGRLERHPGPRSPGLPKPVHLERGRIEAGDQQVNGSLLAWTTVIDTSAAGFSETPAYVAQLEFPVDAVLGIDQQEQPFLGPVAHVVDATPDSFRLNVQIAGWPWNPFFLTTLTFGLPFAVTWIGAESVSRCPGDASPPAQDGDP